MPNHPISNLRFTQSNPNLPSKMPTTTTCTTPLDLCPQCHPLYTYFIAHHTFQPTDLLARPGIYSVVFSRSFPGTSNPRLSFSIAQNMENYLSTLFNRHVNVYESIVVSRGQERGQGQQPVPGISAEPCLKLSFMVDFPYQVPNDGEMMVRMFGQLPHNIPVKSWGVQIPTEQGCASFCRLWFFKEMVAER
jgi:hypothetical protein